MPHPSPTIAFSRPPGRWLTVGIVIGLHAALLLAWRQTRETAPARDEDSGPRIQWIDTIAPAAAARTPETRPVPVPSASGAPPRTQRPRRAAPAPAAAPSATAITIPAAPGSEAPAITVLPPDPFAAEPAPAAPASGADAIRKRAFADLAKIDKDLRKASLNKFAAPDDSPQKRLIAGIQSARRNPTLFEQAEIEEITTGNADAGGRRYKIKTGLGTFCMTTPKVNDEKRDLKYTNCPK
ncbi:hypothetical protein F2P45_23560 [Massilia sp. CCM 8733]|uniref:Uncharacterized protein n=1 Tax=Massilia mucilaginosa TaxID=2609282 RepID=A0ABX0NYG5_9BURK|nr:hypothetical protein [Massilia mucilaginosa]NHZ91960.1 hypothetical protein [Massilia mucilaginosa]